MTKIEVLFNIDEFAELLCCCSALRLPISLEGWNIVRCIGICTKIEVLFNIDDFVQLLVVVPLYVRWSQCSGLICLFGFSTWIPRTTVLTISTGSHSWGFGYKVLNLSQKDVCKNVVPAWVTTLHHPMVEQCCSSTCRVCCRGNPSREAQGITFSLYQKNCQQKQNHSTSSGLLGNTSTTTSTSKLFLLHNHYASLAHLHTEPKKGCSLV